MNIDFQKKHQNPPKYSYPNTNAIVPSEIAKGNSRKRFLFLPHPDAQENLGYCLPGNIVI